MWGFVAASKASGGGGAVTQPIAQRIGRVYDTVQEWQNRVRGHSDPWVAHTLPCRTWYIRMPNAVRAMAGRWSVPKRVEKERRGNRVGGEGGGTIKRGNRGNGWGDDEGNPWATDWEAAHTVWVGIRPYGVSSEIAVRGARVSLARSRFGWVDLMRSMQSFSAAIRHPPRSAR